ncbi:MAG: SOS response-associated peptidase [Oscillospiraceae bacterium]|jgi:putative SOS response-associated peptidase YedK|nr:SOS response-associated peptidase [Oscillospiraceae bacterium]
MCGRFYIEPDAPSFAELLAEMSRFDAPVKTRGEIFPTDVAAVRTERGFAPMKWGFAGFDGKTIINARSETAREKAMFRDSMARRRCLIPASGYFEWQKSGSRKIKYRFYAPEAPLLLAGCWREDAEGASFVILTRNAVGGAETIHDRMPVMVPWDGADAWFDGGVAEFDAARLVWETA